jgi:Ca-activated chloride channel family protein
MVKLDAFTREYGQSFEVPTDRALGLSALTERAKIVRQGAETYLQVGLQAIDREAPRRPPLNVCLVIDRSGSMQNEQKMEYARRAAVQVLQSLADTDHVAVVAYDDVVDILAPATPAANRGPIIGRIENLAPGGSTNIHAGLKAGYAELRKNASGDTLNKLILLSDGRVTAGIADTNSFARLTAGAFDESDIETTSIGMGLDYDEALMMAIAREGKGNYHFIREAAAIGDILHDELEELTQIVAKAVRLRIELAEDVELLSILGSRELEEEEVEAVKRTERVQDERIRRELGIIADREDIEDEPGIKMMIPQFAMGTSHVVMLQIEVPPGRGTREIADVHLKYKDLIFAENREQTESATIEYTGSQDASYASIRQPVKKNELGFRTGEALKAAAALLQRREFGKAAEVIDEQMAVLGVAAQEWNDRDLDRDGELLAAYRQVIADAGTQIASNPELGDYLVKSLTYSAYQRTH